MIEYKGYTGVFEFDSSIDGFHGRIVGLQDVVTFEGRSVDELRREMAESVEDYLELCAEVGKEPDRPYRGEFLVRTTPELHRAATVEAESSRMSLNAWIQAVLTEATGEDRPSSQNPPRSGIRPSRRKARASSGS